MMVPLPGLLDLPLPDKLGLNEISINIEVFSETHAMQVMRHKYNQGLNFYLDFIEQAAEALGPGRIRSMLMIGLEPMAQVSGISVRNFFSATGIPHRMISRSTDSRTGWRSKPSPDAAAG